MLVGLDASGGGGVARMPAWAHGGVRFLLLLRARRIQALKAEESAELIHCNACFTDAFMSYLLTSNLIQVMKLDPHSVRF